MVKSGSFKVNPGSLSGTLGSALGQGLGEAIPREVQQQRLASGLKNFAKNAQNLSPLEQATQLFSIPGITPQMVQVLPQLLQQQQLGQSLGNQGTDQNQPVPFPESSQQQPTAGLTTTPGIQATRQGYIPPTLQQRDQIARENYEANPGRFHNNPQEAIDYTDQQISREKEINQAYQQQRQGELDIQNSVKSSLQSQAGLLGARSVPGDVYSDIEQRAVRSVLPKSEGGEGLTDEEARVKYGKELSDVDRQYNSLRAVGNWTLPTQKPSEILRNLKSIREQFKSRGDLRNLADSYISERILENCPRIIFLIID